MNKTINRHAWINAAVIVVGLCGMVLYMAGDAQGRTQQSETPSSASSSRFVT
jgi:hypothetical protein